MRKIIFAVAILLSSFTASASDYGLARHSVYGAFGFTAGGFALGADYEYLGLREFGVGGYLRMYEEDDDRGADGVVTFGAFVRPHFTKKSWDFYVSPGLAIVSIEDYNGGQPGDATTLGGSVGIGLMYDLNGSAALGVENMRTWVWLDKDYRGLVGETEDFMLRFRVSF